MSKGRWKLMGYAAVACAMLAPVALWGQPPKTAEQIKVESGDLFEGVALGRKADDSAVAGAFADPASAGKLLAASGVAKRKAPRPLGPPLPLKPNDNDLLVPARLWFMKMFAAGVVMGATALVAAYKIGDQPLLAAAGLIMLVGSYIGFGPERWWESWRPPRRHARGPRLLSGRPLLGVPAHEGS